MSRVMVGSRISFFIGFCVVLCGGLLGCTLGGAAGYYGGKIDSIITKIIDTQMAFPGVLLALMLIAVFGNSVQNLILALSVMSVPRFARMSRSWLFKVPQQRICKGSKGKRCIRSENYDSSHLSKSSSGAVGYCNIEFFRSDHVGSWS